MSRIYMLRSPTNLLVSCQLSIVICQQGLLVLLSEPCLGLLLNILIQPNS
jgi:hypothetical protein